MPYPSDQWPRQRAWTVAFCVTIFECALYSEPPTVLAILAIWSTSFAVAVLVPSAPLIFLFAYDVLPISALFIPPLVGLLAAHFATTKNCVLAEVGSSNNPCPESLLESLAAAVVVVLGYLICFAVLSRLLEIPWRAAKFGEPTLDLGMSAAQGFTIFASAVFAMALILFRNVPRSSKAANFAAASMGMIAFASALYLAFGLSSLIEWRE